MTHVATERWLQYGVAAMGVLATLMLGMGERNAILPVLALIVAVGSHHLTDRQGWIQVTPQQAAWLGALATLAAAAEFGRFGRETWLLSLANLLVYLQFILLFHRKIERLYWQLILLSLMQVAVSTALNFSVLFAFVLLAYMAVGLCVLALMHLFALNRRFATTPDAVAWRSPSRSLGAAEPTLHFELAASPLTAALRPGYWWQVAVAGAGSLVLTAMLFLAVPRIGKQQWIPAGDASLQVVGATDTVRLGDIGTIITSTEAAMQVRLLDFKKQPQTYNLIDEPYFRGMVLSEYEWGEWRRMGETDFAGNLVNPQEVNQLPWEGDLVLQQITVEPLDTQTLYCLYPPYCVSETGPLYWNDGTHSLARRDTLRAAKFSFELVTSALQQGKQIPYVPATRMERRDIRRLTQLPQDSSLAGLRALADQTVANISPENAIARGIALQDLLCFKGKYSYSLAQSTQDSAVDPVEDFLLNTRKGHCEYFASALALMLRSQGLPARIVVGFKGGDFNRFGSFYQVRQSNSHAWVEMYVAPENLPDTLPAPLAQWSYGAWLRLDPTPGDNSGEAPAAMRYTLSQLRQATDLLRYLWSNYVLGLDAQKQQAAVYAPLVQGLRETAQWLTEPENWRDLARQAWNYLRAERFGWLGGEWFNWRAGAASSGICLAVAIAVRWLRPRVGTWLARTRLGRLIRTTAVPLEVQFYRHYEEMLARHGLVRGASVTQREFADQVSHDLSLRPQTIDVERVPQRVVQFFYDVRFGDQPLDKLRLQQVEQAVAQLETALSASASGAA